MQTSHRALSPHEERNKSVVLEYYGLLCQQWNFDAARQHLASSFIQHNPTIGDGIAGLQEWIAKRPPFAQALHADIKRVVVDGDFVVLHTVVRAPTTLGIPDMVIADFFRLEDYKVAEHWDIIQPVPAAALHANGIA